MKKLQSLLISSIGSLLILPAIAPILPVPLQKAVASSEIAQTLTDNQIRQLAQAVTVQVISTNSQGSGVIIARKGNTYTIITNAHVINRKESYQIQTPDGKVHSANVISRGNSLEGNDLGVLEFQSTQSYQVISLAIAPQLNPNQPIWATGFPDDSADVWITQGKITLLSPKPFIGGYQIGYDINVKPGMSGGALLNQKGELIGINGLTSYPILDDAYTYQDGSRPDARQIKDYQQVSFAVPIQSLVLVAPELAIIPAQWKAGLNIAEKVDRIAQKITVRIDIPPSEANPTGVEGSGVIIGKAGNTYYVATACHVVVNQYAPCNLEEVRKKISNQQHTLVTPDGEKYPISVDKIVISENSDAALISFTSNKNYTVATLGNYTPSLNEKHWSFVSGFPRDLKGKRKFTAGYRFHRDKGLLVAFDHSALGNSTTNSTSLANTTTVKVNITGYELIYSNLSQHGMSGGPVLDTNGQVIGIDGGVEGDEIRLQLGYAFGVPSASVVELAKTKLQPEQLNISTTVPSELKETDILTLKTHPSFIVAPPAPDVKGQQLGRQLVEYGNQLWRLEHYEEAIQVLQKVIKNNDEWRKYHSQAYYTLGLIYDTQAQNYDDLKLSDKAQEKNTEAVNAFDNAIRLKPNFHQAWFRKSVSLRELRKYDEALTAIDQAIALKKKETNSNNSGETEDFKLYFYRGSIFYFWGRYPEAIQASTQSIKINSTVQAYIMRAGSHLNLKDYQGAVADYTEVINRQPDSAAIYSLRSNIYFLYLKDPQKGLADAGKAIELAPNNPKHYAERGIFYFLTQNYQMAINDFSQAIELNPHEAEYYQARANSHESLGEYSEALNDINQAIKLKPNDAALYRARGATYSIMGNQQKAIADFDRAIQLNPQYGSAYRMRGLARELNDLEGALADYDQAINLISESDPIAKALWSGSLSPEEVQTQEGKDNAVLISTISPNSIYASVYSYRGNTRLQLNNKEGALSDYNKAIELDPDDGSIYMTRGDYYTQVNEPEKAKADYEKALQLSTQEIETKPRATLLYMQRANLHEKLKDYQGALADLSKAIELNPKNVLALSMRADIHEKLGNSKAALKDYTQAIEIQPDDVNAYSNRGRFHFLKEDYQAAIDDYSQAIQRQPESLIAYWGRAIAYNKSKEPQKAIDDYAQAIKLAPASYKVSLYNERGRVQYELKDYQAALDDANRILEIKPDDVSGYRLRSVVYTHLKDYPKALDDANQVVKLKPDSPNSYFERGTIHHRQGNYKDALSDYNLALSKDKKYINAIFNIGGIQYEQGNIEGAEQQWQQVLEIDSEHPETLLALAVIHYTQGDTQKGLQMAQKALAKDKDFGDTQHLKDNLWGDKLVQDAEKLLVNPTIQAVLAR